MHSKRFQKPRTDERQSVGKKKKCVLDNLQNA